MNLNQLNLLLAKGMPFGEILLLFDSEFDLYLKDWKEKKFQVNSTHKQGNDMLSLLDKVVERLNLTCEVIYTNLMNNQKEIKYESGKILSSLERGLGVQSLYKHTPISNHEIYVVCSEERIINLENNELMGRYELFYDDEGWVRCIKEYSKYFPDHVVRESHHISLKQLLDIKEHFRLVRNSKGQIIKIVSPGIHPEIHLQYDSENNIIEATIKDKEKKDESQ